MLPRKSALSSRTTSGDLKPGGGMNRWMKLYKRSLHSTKLTRPWRRRQGGLGQGGRDILHIAKQMDHTNRMLLTRTVYATMLVNLCSMLMTRWTHGQSTMLGSWTLSLNGQAMSSLSPPPPPPPPPPPQTASPQLPAPTQCVCDPDL